MRRIIATLAILLTTTTLGYAKTLLLGCQTNHVEFVLAIADNTATITWDVKGARANSVELNFDNPPMLKIYQRFANGMTFVALYNVSDDNGITEMRTTDGETIKGDMTCIRLD